MIYMHLKIFILSNFVLICLGEVEHTNATGIWTKATIHYTIRSEDFDIHSKQIIISAFRKIEQESCLRFYFTDIRPDSISKDKHLYIQNEQKLKQCPRGKYDYNGKVIKMTIGYNCLQERGVAQIFMDMLRSGVTSQPDNLSNKLSDYEPSKKMSDKNLLTLDDHEFINKYYKKECEQHKSFSFRRQMEQNDFDTGVQFTQQNENYYNPKVWPFGIIMYGIDKMAANFASSEVVALKLSMDIIEKYTCIVFEDISSLGLDKIQPKNVIWFNETGTGIPELGFQAGKQFLGMTAFAIPITPAHSGHLLFSLLRILGLPFESNRFDRDDFVAVNTKNILEGYEMFFDKDPQDAYLNVPYDFDSMTHPPVNWLCKDFCNMGEQTIKPLNDNQWKLAMSVGHHETLSKMDIFKLNMLYQSECDKRDGGAAAPN